MRKSFPVFDVVKKPIVLIGALALVVVLIVWLLAFFEPESHKLSSLDSQKASLQQDVLLDNAHLQRVRAESHHVGQIQAIDSKLKGYVPANEDLYTYIQTLSKAGNQTGVTITSLQPSALQAASGTSYMAIPITADIRGTYDHLVAFLKAIYDLPRLTDVNSVTIDGGGPGTNRATDLSATLNLAIFTSQKAGTSS